MIRVKDIKWYLEDPTRLMQMKPFTRGGWSRGHSFENSSVLSNQTLSTGLVDLELKPISQDRYLTEYNPSLHYMILNKSLPKINIRLDGCDFPSGMIELTQTASFQKLIHSAHVRSLTSNPLELNLCQSDEEQGGIKIYEKAKTEWIWRNMASYLSKAINTCKQVGNCGLLFSFDSEENKLYVTNYSYEDGYQIVPNYDEYGIEIARSLVYRADGKLIIDTYDNKKHYRIVQKTIADEEGKLISNGWNIQSEIHGFSICPLLHKRGKVAWEYAESSIEMWELLKNISAITSKRFGTFALALWGDLDSDSFKKDNSTLIINLVSDTTNGKQDVKALEYPESKNIDNFIKGLERDISLFSSTSFITPSDISSTGSGGNGIALAMSNDYALAVQSANDWNPFVNKMFYLFQEGLDLEENKTNKIAKLRVNAKIVPWSLETNNTKITNLAMEAKWLSMKTLIEKSPDAAPDEEQRIIAERGALVPQGSNIEDEDSDKALRISQNKSNVIVDNKKDFNKNQESEVNDEH